MFLDKLFSAFSSTKNVTIDQTLVNGQLYKFINSEVLQGTDIAEKDFWDGFIRLQMN